MTNPTTSTPAPHARERHCDVCVVGGSAAGLAAALQLGRQRRSVIVIDAGDPRNGPAAHMHGYLGHDAAPPHELIARGRAEARDYGVEVLSGAARRVTRADGDRFRVEADGGLSILARRVLAATGLIDELPDIENLAAHWGRDVIHCPFCHGYEVRDQRLVQIATHPMSLRTARLFAHLTDRLTVVVPAAIATGDYGVEALRVGGVSIVHGAARRIIDGPDGRLRALELATGDLLDAGIVVVGPRFRARIEPFAALDLRPTAHPSGLGDTLATDETGQTDVPGLYAAGNITDPSQQVLQAAADGSRVGAMIAFDLADQDLRCPGKAPSNESDWDERYSGDQLWSGKPNATLVTEAADLAPAHALDVGAGEGGDALWLAERGWAVTASDVSTRALARIGTTAGQRGLRIDTHHGDANALDAFPRAAFDLVATHYAAIPRTPDRRAVRNLLAAVAPGGTLLVVSHDPEPLRPETRRRLAEHPPGFDPDAYVGIEDFVAELTESGDWAVEVHEKRPRAHVGRDSPHVDDIVLRARRR